MTLPLPYPEELEEALSMVSCPYYTDQGTCTQGCHQEPACVVNQPTEGWEAVIERYRTSSPTASKQASTEGSE